MAEPRGTVVAFNYKFFLPTTMLYLNPLFMQDIPKQHLP